MPVQMMNHVEHRVDGQWRWVEDAPMFGDDWSPDLRVLLFSVRGRSVIEPAEDDLQALSKPRGLPPDLSGELRRKFDEFSAEFYHATWHTLRDLLDFDWDRLYAQGELVRAHDEMFLSFSVKEDALPRLGLLGAPDDVRLVCWLEG